MDFNLRDLDRFLMSAAIQIESNKTRILMSLESQQITRCRRWLSAP